MHQSAQRSGAGPVSRASSNRNAGAHRETAKDCHGISQGYACSAARAPPQKGARVSHLLPAPLCSQLLGRPLHQRPRHDPLRRPPAAPTTTAVRRRSSPTPCNDDPLRRHPPSRHRMAARRHAATRGAATARRCVQFVIGRDAATSATRSAAVGGLLFAGAREGGRACVAEAAAFHNRLRGAGGDGRGPPLPAPEASCASRIGWAKAWPRGKPCPGPWACLLATPLAGRPLLLQSACRSGDTKTTETNMRHGELEKARTAEASSVANPSDKTRRIPRDIKQTKTQNVL